MPRRSGVTMRGKRGAHLRRAVYELLEQGPVGARRTRIVSRIVILLIVINLLAAALETVPSLDAQYATVFSAIEWVSLIVFTAEYLARLWCAIEHAPDR